MRGIVGLGYNFLFLLGNALATIQLRIIACNQLILCREFFQFDLLFLSGQEIMLIESVAV